MVSLKKNVFVIGGALIIILSSLFLLYKVVTPDTPDWVTAKVERGTVSEIVSVSGFVKAENTAKLAFPVSGVVTEVYAYEGMQVQAGEILATLGSSELIGKRNEALAAIERIEAAYDKLLIGASDSDRIIAETTQKNAEEALARTMTEEDEKVSKARRTLLSSDLMAQSADPKERATAPLISGTYTCEEEGSYIIEVYSSNAYSGYSYRFSGLEEGTAAVSTHQPAPLGGCGLFIQFTEGNTYAVSKWQIDVPNKRSSSYLTHANTYELALRSRTTAIAEAEERRHLATLETNSVLADPRNEDIREAQARVEEAYAQLAQIDALLRDRSVIAPFDGSVTGIDIVKGETATAEPVVTLLASDAFKLTARIPEIDITKLKEGQPAEVVFDAASLDTQYGKISYISPLATLIDGVAYFETTIMLERKPEWLRSGLNADVDIIVGEKENVLRIPKRFLIDHGDETYSVQIERDGAVATTTINVAFRGNDGFVEISGLNEGETVIAP